MDEMEKTHETFLQGAQMELKKDMALLQKKIMMDTVSVFTHILWVFLNCRLLHFTLLIFFCNYVIATTGYGHREEVTPVNAVLKSEVLLFILKTSLMLVL